MRVTLGVIAGILVALATILLVEWTGHLLYPFPSDAVLADPERAGRAFASVPIAAKLIVVFGWFAGALVGSLVAAMVGRLRGLAWLIAAVVAIAGILNILMIPHPAWMQIAAVVAPLLGGLGAVHLAGLPGRSTGRPDHAA
jgi:hypothetical protein